MVLRLFATLIHIMLRSRRKVADPKARHWEEQAGLEEQKCFIENLGGTGECRESGSGPGES